MLCHCSCLQLKEELHVTLWHSEDAELGEDAVLRSAVLSAQGSEVVFEVSHVDWEPGGMVAAAVQVSCCSRCYMGTTHSTTESHDNCSTNNLQGSLRSAKQDHHVTLCEAPLISTVQVNKP